MAETRTQTAPTPTSTAERLMDSAERRIRIGGYNGFSFRDLAADVGIKSASVHHHFPTKEDLVVRLADRYADRFIEALPDVRGAAIIGAYHEAFRASIAPGGAASDGMGQMCLCGMLGAETAGLPPSVAAAARRFFERTTDHLAERLEGDLAARRAKALQVLGVLEGALIVARALDDLTAFDATSACLTAEG